jgi:hypothetical protein
MAIPAKPTAKLVIDGVIGQLTRDAAAYAMQVNKFTSGTEVATLGGAKLTVVTFRKHLQTWLNRYQHWKKINEDPESNLWPNTLTPDGKWGSQTETKLGGTLIYLSSGNLQGCDVYETDLAKAGRNIKMFQGLLNSIIWTPYLPKTPYMYLSNTTPKWASDTDTWSNSAGGKY